MRLGRRSRQIRPNLSTVWKKGIMTIADIKNIINLLLKKYPHPKIALKFNNPMELLVATILSAQCTDVRVNGVTERLFNDPNCFPSKR